MQLFHCQQLEFIDGVILEPTPETNRLVLWLRGEVVGGFQHWERINNVPGEPIAVEQGLCAM
jgi:hypothetical protein